MLDHNFTIKSELRQAMTAVRTGMSPLEVEICSQKIQRALLALPEVEAARSFFVYVSCRAEPRTRELIEHWWSQGKIVAVPKVLSSTLMEPRVLTDWTQLQPGPLGILAPTDSTALAEELEVCITPGLAFTTHGDRLGRGRGHYDRFLEHHPSMLVIGLAFENQIVPSIPTEAHDRPMDMIVTESRVIKSKS